MWYAMILSIVNSACEYWYVYKEPVYIYKAMKRLSDILTLLDR